MLSLCGIVGVEVPARNKELRGGPAYHVVDWSHVKVRCRGRLAQFEHTSVLHWSMDGQVQRLKRAEKDQVDQEVIRVYIA